MRLSSSLVAFALLFGALPIAAAPVDDSRSRHAEAGLVFERVDGERARLAAENDRLASEIAAAKASSRAPLLPSGGQLDALLKSAHAVARRLETLDREAAAARSQLESARVSLAAALDAEIAATRKALPTLTGASQKAQFERLRSISAEREALRAPASGSSARVELPAVAASADASADELRELADEARDHAEAIQSRLSSLESRLQALQARRRLLRAAQAFTRDEALFGEGERSGRTVVRVPSGTFTAAGAGPAPAKAPEVVAARDTNAGGGQAAPPPGAAPADPEADEAPAFAGAAEGDSEGAADDDGARDSPPPEPLAGERGVPGDLSAGPGSAGASLVVDQALDPALVVGDVDDLSPQALADHIRRVEAKREALRRTAKALEDRRRELERQAQAAEGDEGR